MYWPIGTPRIYATTTSQAAARPRAVVSHDGLEPSTGADNSSLLSTTPSTSRNDEDNTPKEANLDVPLQVPPTPFTPATPAVNSVEHDYYHDVFARSFQDLAVSDGAAVPSGEPIVALKVSRTGHLFAVITPTTMTIWQTKPTVILAVVVRSETSIKSYGANVALLLRPDSAIFVVQTSSGYLITYSLATDAESRVYKPHFADHKNIQRRRQSHFGGPGNTAPDQILLGPGEGSGVRDVSVRFRRVIKVDAGIECALALDDELVVATRKPAAVQCIRWTPDSTGSQTSTELVSRMGWLEKKTCIKEMTHDRPMNLSTWITSGGKAFAVQRSSSAHATQSQNNGNGEVDPKKLFRGYCFHSPQSESSHAVRAVINARFSLIAVGCADGSIHVYSARDYVGNIPASHVHNNPVSPKASGSLTALTYSPDGYCLFAGYENGWAAWSVYGKSASHSFGVSTSVASNNKEEWLLGIREACWIGGACELLLVGRQNEAIWALEMARSAVTGCYSPPNLFRTVLQSSSSVMVYRGYDLPDLTSISAEPFLWHTARIPSNYLLNQWPIKCTVVSSDGRYVAVAGRRGLAHYSINSGRWKTFANGVMENEFQVRGGMCWYQHILVAAVEANRSYELRLYSRETALDSTTVMFTQQMPAPIVLITPSGEDSLLVYTYDNLLYHFVFAPVAGALRPIQVGQIAFHGIVRSPARVRGLSWILPESQLVDGDPSQDVAVASVLFLVDGKLVLLQPSFNNEGHLKYDMRVISQNVEYYISMRDQSSVHMLGQPNDRFSLETEEVSLRNALWVFEGHELRAWPDIQDVLRATTDSTKELPPTVLIAVDFYPLSILMSKGIILGVEPDLVQRRDINFSFFRFSIRTHLFLPAILRFHLTNNNSFAALKLAQNYENLEYFAHALEILLHHVLDEEVDSAPAPEAAILPRVLSLLSSFRQYLDIVVQCTRKTEVRSWRTLFAYLPPPGELFEESLQRGSLKTAGGYLLILHTFEELDTASEQSVRLFSRAIREEDWELCKELARFLAAMDESGETLREAMQLVNLRVGQDRDEADLMTRLGVPSSRRLNGGTKQDSDIGSDVQSAAVSETSSFGTASPS
ncbi:RIC1-domain-containing protein [Pseudomassariella vexata]|uniref:RIC1-domain-containing protein n=1 Tax=Pseudomassariella vexata TaxID=1141098 RepID=A0A1Y2DSQ2_9PEZI|nr:RIC1-domain-containing protein [Pseudomassariella vexata]ORY62302.1 RIC1-domain-containing protein [Pseudomassariella vexata]